jgi:hypothetical protein
MHRSPGARPADTHTPRIPDGGAFAPPIPAFNPTIPGFKVHRFIAKAQVHHEDPLVALRE